MASKSAMQWAGWSPDKVDGEQWSNRVEVTAHPLETGEEISDHVIRLPSEVTIAVTLLDWPIPGAEGEDAAGEGRSRRLFNRLLDKIGTAATLITSQRGMANAVLAEVVESRGSPTGQVKAALKFVPIRYGNTREIDLDPSILAADVRDGAAAEKDLGQQSTETPNADEISRGSSTLFDLFGG